MLCFSPRLLLLLLLMSFFYGWIKQQTDENREKLSDRQIQPGNNQQSAIQTNIIARSEINIYVCTHVCAAWHKAQSAKRAKRNGSHTVFNIVKYIYVCSSIVRHFWVSGYACWRMRILYDRSVIRSIRRPCGLRFVYIYLVRNGTLQWLAVVNSQIAAHHGHL